jgi:hypothetical protein
MPGLPAGRIKQSLTSPSLPEELLPAQSIGAFSSLARPGSTDAFSEGLEMKHQAHFGTRSAIVSREAAQIRMLVEDLAHIVDILDAGVAADLPRADDAIDLDTRRHNLMVTIAVLEDRLGSIENVRSREDAARVNSTLPRARAARPH